MRRYGVPPQKGQYYRARPGAYGIFWHKGKLLLTMQSYRANAEQEFLDWQLPGGGVENHETMIPALARETLEETGWKVAISNKYTTYRRFVFMPDYGYHAEKICHIFMGRALYPVEAPSEPHHKAALVPPQTALSNLGNPADKDIVANLLGCSPKRDLSVCGKLRNI